jgi:hypothetical protein
MAYQRRKQNWHDDYRQWRYAYISGAFDRFEAADKLKELGYRDDALRIELLEWRKLRDDYEKRHR